MQTHECKMCNASEYECQNCDFEQYSRGEMTPNVKHGRMMTQGA